MLEERELPAVERLGEGRVAVREPEPHEQLGGERRAELVEPGRLAGRLRRGDREDGPDAVGPSVERLEEHGACGERRRGREPDRADRVGDLGGRVRHVLLRAERGAELEHAVAVGLATEPQREQAARLRPVAGELAVGGDADANARAELALDAARQTRRAERRPRTSGSRRTASAPARRSSARMPRRPSRSPRTPRRRAREDRRGPCETARRPRTARGRRARAHRSRRRARGAAPRARSSRRHARGAGRRGPRRSRARAAGTRRGRARHARRAPRTRRAAPRRRRRARGGGMRTRPG